MTTTAISPVPNTFHPSERPKELRGFVNTIKIVILMAVNVLLVIPLIPLFLPIMIARGCQYLGRQIVYLVTGKRDVALIITGTDDHNGAFEEMPVDFGISLDLYPHYKKSAERIRDINLAIDAIPEKERIKILWIRGHGRPNAIKLGPNTLTNQANYIHFGNVRALERSLHRLAPDAVIVLQSCRTGKKENGAECIAEKIAACAPGRLLYASTEATSNGRACIYSLDPLRVIFRSKVDMEKLGFFKEIAQDLLLAYGVKIPVKESTVTYQVPPCA